MENKPVFRLETFIFSFVFLLAFAFFLVGLNPTFYVDDSPETITACVLLGIPHPPGYPLHTLLGHFFSWLPLAQYPFRINLFSAALAASVSAFLFAFLKGQLKLPAWLAAPFALLWMVGGTTYPAALSAKTGIYQLTALFLLAIIWALFKKRLGLAAFLLGLSLANHWMSMLTFLPGFGILVYYQWKEDVVETRRIYRDFCLFLLGISVYLFLPLRALQNPWLNWGNPSTLHNFISDFLRNQYSNTRWGAGQEPVLDETRADFIWDHLRLRHLRDTEFPADGRTQSLIVRDYAVFRNSLGVYYEDLGDAAKAAITSRSKAADLLRMDRYYDRCLEQFKWAADWAPQDAQFNFNLGNAYVHLGRLRDAMGLYDKATRLNPRYANAYFNWAVITFQTGDRAKAKELFGKTLAIDPNNAEAKRGLDMLGKMGQ